MDMQIDIPNVAPNGPPGAIAPLAIVPTSMFPAGAMYPPHNAGMMNRQITQTTTYSQGVPQQMGAMTPQKEQMRHECAELRERLRLTEAYADTEYEQQIKTLNGEARDLLDTQMAKFERAAKEYTEVANDQNKSAEARSQAACDAKDQQLQAANLRATEALDVTRRQRDEITQATLRANHLADLAQSESATADYERSAANTMREQIQKGNIAGKASKIKQRKGKIVNVSRGFCSTKKSRQEINNLPIRLSMNATSNSLLKQKSQLKKESRPTQSTISTSNNSVKKPERKGSLNSKSILRNKFKIKMNSTNLKNAD